MMEYILITILQFLGVGFHVMQKIISIGDTHKEVPPFGVAKIFWKEDWDTLVVSALIWFLNLTVHYILSYYHPPFTYWEYYMIVAYALALLFGYAGQRMIYKYFGSAERFIDNQVNNKLNL